jgi:hypothetical protein
VPAYALPRTGEWTLLAVTHVTLLD